MIRLRLRCAGCLFSAAVLPFILPLFFMLLFLPGCYSTRYESNSSAQQEVRLRQNFFVLGMLGSADLDLTEQCPRGVAGFREVFTPGDMLFTLVSVGLYSPKTVYVSCVT